MNIIRGNHDQHRCWNLKLETFYLVILVFIQYVGIGGDVAVNEPEGYVTRAPCSRVLLALTE